MEETIKVWPYANLCLTDNPQLRYGVKTLHKDEKLVKGIWDTIYDSGKYCTNNHCNSLKNLVQEIKNGCDKLDFRNLEFIFDIQGLDTMFVNFRRPDKYRVSELERERPLTEEERQEFLMQFDSLDEEI